MGTSTDHLGEIAQYIRGLAVREAMEATWNLKRGRNVAEIKMPVLPKARGG